MSDPKTPKPAPGDPQEFQRRLQEDPAGTLADLGIEMLEFELARLRGSLQEFMVRSHDPLGSSALEQKASRTIGDLQITTLVGLRDTNNPGTNINELESLTEPSGKRSKD